MRLALATALLATALPAGAATLADLLEAAWQRQPHAGVLAARQASVAAGGAALDSPFAGSPAIGLGNRNDRLSGDRGKWENEIELSAPLWLPGQRAARRDQIAAEATALDASAIAARLALAGELRGAVWDAVAARELARAQQARLGTAAALARDVERRVRAGELARTDLLAVEDELLAAEAAVAQAEGTVARALEQLRRLSGRTELPEQVDEPVRARPDDRPHPRLEAARLAVTDAESRVKAVVASARDNPEVGVQFRRDRDVYGGEARDSLRFAIRIPFATDARNRPRVAAARAEVAQAAGEQRLAELVIEADERAALAALEAAGRQRTLAERRQATAQERVRLLGRAFELGELGAPEWLRAQALAREAQLALIAARAEEGRAVALLNQARGVLP